MDFCNFVPTINCLKPPNKWQRMPPKNLDAKFEALGLQGYPKTATVEVTNRCNARCGICFIDHTAEHQDLSTEKMYFILDKLAANGVLNVLISGGEPFLRSDILQILEHAIGKDFFGLTLYTNGIVLNDDHIQFLIANRQWFTEIKMSAFSHDPKLNDACFNVPGATEKIVHNAERLAGGGLNVRFSVVALDCNVDTLQATEQFYAQRGFSIQASPFLICTPGKNGTKDPRNLKKFMPRYFNHYSRENIEAFKKVMNKRLANPGDHIRLCQGSVISIMVGPRGDITPCVSFRSMKIGSIFDQRPLNEILQSSPAYKRLKNMKKTDFEPCRSCRFVGFCDVCPGRIHTATGELVYAEPQTCEHARALYSLMRS
ncbi:MAG: radical SAM protein [Chitinivibrionales bacterium]|nr:radical SAM protein [Chitinivibrionales bacterium]